MGKTATGFWPLIYDLSKENDFLMTVWRQWLLLSHTEYRMILICKLQ